MHFAICHVIAYGLQGQKYRIVFFMLRNLIYGPFAGKIKNKNDTWVPESLCGIGNRIR